jgi:hypothetical protein
VPRLLARGISAERVTSITGTPAALVALIREHEPPSERARASWHPVRTHRRRIAGLAATKRLTTIAIFAAGITATICWHVPLVPLSVAAAAIITHRWKVQSDAFDGSTPESNGISRA